jgi:hypothetical protein
VTSNLVPTQQRIHNCPGKGSKSGKHTNDAPGPVTLLFDGF